MEGNTQKMNTIGWAVKQLHNGSKVARKGWNGSNQWLQIQNPDEHSKMTLPYIYLHTVDNKLVPWNSSQSDLLATDWEVIE